MPRYEVVTQLTCDIDAATPEGAAAVLIRDLAGGEASGAVVRHLALWRLPEDGTPSPLPASLRRHLAAFFAGVGRSAAAADAVFRARVAVILASEPHGASAQERTGPARDDRSGPARLAEWESEGGRSGGAEWGD